MRARVAPCSHGLRRTGLFIEVLQSRENAEPRLTQIIETHSEPFLNRLQTKAGMGPNTLAPADI
jgi:hypothetical protein